MAFGKVNVGGGSSLKNGDTQPVFYMEESFRNRVSVKLGTASTAITQSVDTDKQGNVFVLQNDGVLYRCDEDLSVISTLNLSSASVFWAKVDINDNVIVQFSNQIVRKYSNNLSTILWEINTSSNVNNISLSNDGNVVLQYGRNVSEYDGTEGSLIRTAVINITPFENRFAIDPVSKDLYFCDVQSGVFKYDWSGNQVWEYRLATYNAFGALKFFDDVYAITGTNVSQEYVIIKINKTSGTRTSADSLTSAGAGNDFVYINGTFYVAGLSSSSIIRFKNIKDSSGNILTSSRANFSQQQTGKNNPYRLTINKKNGELIAGNNGNNGNGALSSFQVVNVYTNVKQDINNYRH